MNEYIILYIYMYLILLYIIIIFFIFLYDNNIEGQSDDNIELNFVYRIISDKDDDKNNFSLTLSKNTMIKDILSQIYKKNDSIDIYSMRLEYNNILLNNDNDLSYYTELKDGNELKSKDTIIVKNSLYNDINSIHYIDTNNSEKLEKEYKKYYKSLKKISNINKNNTHHIKYSDKILKLFDNKSQPVLNPYNKNPYISKNKDKHIQGYLDDDDLLDNIIGKNNEYDNDDNNNKCCTKSKLNIENNMLVTDPTTYSIFNRVHHYENSYSTLKSYNYDYTDYMKQGKNIYKYLSYPTKLRSLKISVD